MNWGRIYENMYIKEVIEQLIDNLPEAMQSISRNKYRNKTSKIRGSNWSYFPNVSEFSISIQGWDPIFRLKGIKNV